MSDKWLNDITEFDCPFVVHSDGDVTNTPDMQAPEVFDDESCNSNWELLSGFTGQYGYNGPMMHPSEYIGGALAKHILSTPGVYCAVADPDGEGWYVAHYLRG